MNRKWITAILIYAGLIALCIIAVYGVPSLRGMLERTYIAEYGRIDVSDEVSAFIVRDETVYVAKQPSFINRLAETDKLVKAHTRVVELTPDEDAIKAEAEAKATKEKTLRDAGVIKDEEQPAEGEDAAEAEDEETADAGKYSDLMEDLGDSVKKTEEGYNKGAGYVSYHIDGAEARLSTDKLDSLSYDDFKDLANRRAVEVPSKKCKSGYPVFKIVRNSKWYLVFYINEADAEKYEPGEAVTLDINGVPADATISQVLTGSRQARVTLSCKTFFDGFLESRVLDTRVTVASAEGLVLEDSSIVEAPDGRRGVFVVNKLGEHVFKPVRAKADDGKKCVAYSDIYVDSDGNFVETIDTYDEIVANPTDEDLAGIGIKAEEESAEDAAENN